MVGIETQHLPVAALGLIEDAGLVMANGGRE